MTEVVILVGGRRAYTYDGLAELTHGTRTPSALRNIAHRRNITPAAHITRTVPVYYPEQLGLTDQEPQP